MCLCVWVCTSRLRMHPCQRCEKLNREYKVCLVLITHKHKPYHTSICAYNILSHRSFRYIYCRHVHHRCMWRVQCFSRLRFNNGYADMNVSEWRAHIRRPLSRSQLTYLTSLFLATATVATTAAAAAAAYNYYYYYISFVFVFVSLFFKYYFDML